MVEEEFVEELDDEVLDLQDLIVEGTDYKKTISIELPDGRVGAAIIRPISTVEYGECVRKYKRSKSDVSLLIDICAKGLLNVKEEPYTKTMIENLPAGAILRIGKEIQELSGIYDEEKEKEIRKELMDF